MTVKHRSVGDEAHSFTSNVNQCDFVHITKRRIKLPELYILRCVLERI